MKSVSDCLVRDIHTRGNFVGLWQCSSCSSLHKGADTGPADGYLLHALETVLGDTANLLAMARIDVTSWRSWTACATSVGSRYRLMLPVVTLTLAKCKTSEKQSEKMSREKMSVASTCKTIPVLGVVSLLPI